MAAYRKTTSDEIKKLYQESSNLNLKYSEMNVELVRTQSALAAKSNEIKVERVPGVQKLTTVFEPDPNLVERNQMLSEELEIALVVALLHQDSRAELRFTIPKHEDEIRRA